MRPEREHPGSFTLGRRIVKNTAIPGDVGVAQVGFRDYPDSLIQRNVGRDLGRF